MRRIIDHTTRRVTVQHEDGGESQQEVVHSVTYDDHIGARHTLTFHPAGTDVSGADEESPRIVGEHVYEDGSTMQEYRFATAEEAVDAYENGRVV